jgi:hypothetical protein
MPGNPEGLQTSTTLWVRSQIVRTDLVAKELPPGLTLPELQAKLAGHTKGAASLICLFVKPE